VLFARRGVDGVAGSRLDDGAVAAAEQGGGVKISMVSFRLSLAVSGCSGWRWRSAHPSVICLSWPIADMALGQPV
jgi:hypothetical protein